MPRGPAPRGRPKGTDPKGTDPKGTDPKGTDTVKTVVAFSRHGDLRQLSVASTSYRVRAGPRAGDLGVVVTFGDVTEIMRLRTAEATLQGEVAAEHAKLQAAYLRLEDAADRARRTARRTNLVRTVAIVAIAAGLAAIVVTNWSGVVGVAALRSAGGDATAANDATFTVTAGPVTSRVAVVGIVDAGSVVSVVGPFDGLVREKHFTYGGQTERGTPLLTLDTSDIQVRLRDAEAAEIKAQQHVAELYDWNNGPDVSRARRTLASAALETGSLGSRLAQTKMLLSKGIVAADEYNQMVQQQRNRAVADAGGAAGSRRDPGSRQRRQCTGSANSSC